MVEETKPQAGASKTTKRSRGRKGKTVQQVQTNNEATDKNKAEVINGVVNEELNSDSDFDSGSKQYNFHTLAMLLEPVPKLTLCNYHSWSTHIKSFLQSVLHAMKHLEGAYCQRSHT
ncbi:uncharacterized protein UHOD_11339 [Ustilago sp. UG-2017b]|nr:uncharacterized protein UHOD_11339 [Ustilago sp. UG-2017b]